MFNESCCDVHNFNATLRCAFVKNNSDCQDVEGFLNYINFVYCDFESSLLPIVVCSVWMFVLFTGLGTTADDYFCPSLEVISKVLKLSHNVAGVTFLAFGNGAPDIFSSVAGTQQMRPDLVIGALLGAGIFVTCIVAGSIILTVPFKMMERPFLRDVIFYLVAVYWTFYLLQAESISLFSALGFIFLYIVYMIVVLVSHHIYVKYLKPRSVTAVKTLAVPTITVTDDTQVTKVVDIEKFPPEDDIVPWGAPPIARRWSSENIHNIRRPTTPIISRSDSTINLVAAAVTTESTPLLQLPMFDVVEAPQTPIGSFICALSPFDCRIWRHWPWWKKMWHIFKSPVVLCLNLSVPVVNYDKPLNNWNRPMAAFHCILCPVFFVFSIGCSSFLIGDKFPSWAVALLTGFAVSIFVWFSSQNDQSPRYHAIFAFAGFATSVTWIYLIANEIVSVLKTVGVVLNLSDSILGLTVLAWGNSLSDLIANVAIAKQGFPRMGISACFGGPLFNLLMGIGIPFSIMTFEKKSHIVEIVYQRITTILTSFLCVSLVSSLIIIPLMRFNLHRIYGIYLYVLYFLFISIAIMNEMKVF